MQPDDLDALITPGRPSLHPDGTRAVISYVRPDIASDDYVGQLWSIPTDPAAGAGLRLTAGHRDTGPRYSPDGSRIAFLRTVEGGRAQLYLIPGAGGEARQVTEQTLGVSAFDWSPTALGSLSPHAFPSPVATAPEKVPTPEKSRRG